MAAISHLAVRDVALVLRELEKRRKSWPHRNPGVMLVFCIVFVVAVALIGLFISKKISARRAAKSTV